MTKLMTGVQWWYTFSALFFFFLFEGTGKGELLVNNEHMHEYTVNVLGVPDFASHLVSGHWR